MFAQFFAMFKAMFSVVTTVADAANLGAMALKNVAEVTNETSLQYVEEARINRLKKMRQLDAELAVVEAESSASIKSVSKAKTA